MPYKAIIYLCVYGAMFCLAISVSWWFAELCNPNAVWLWHEMFGLSFGSECP